MASNYTPNDNWTPVSGFDADQLANYGAYETTNSRNPVAHIGFARLQTIAMQDAAEAQKAAAAAAKRAADAAVETADAAKATAKSTADSAWWLMWSAVALFITAAATILIPIIAAGWHTDP